MASVQPRMLENYDGILIMTRNRITQFDIAVQNQANLGIKYRELQPDQKQKILNNFVDEIKPENISNAPGIERWFENGDEANEWVRELNGRQVRNKLFSAVSLARMGHGELKLIHIKKMT